MDKEKIYYKPKEAAALGYPLPRIMELCRSGRIGKKSKPEAEHGYHYIFTLKELEEHWNDWTE